MQPTNPGVDTSLPQALPKDSTDQSPRPRPFCQWSPDEGFIAAALQVSLCHPNWAAFSAGGTNRAVWAKEGLQHLGNLALKIALMLKALFSPHCSRCVCLHFFVVLAGDVPMSM